MKKTKQKIIRYARMTVGLMILILVCGMLVWALEIPEPHRSRREVKLQAEARVRNAIATARGEAAEAQKKAPPTYKGTSTATAYVTAQDFVKQQLIAPRTAKFPFWGVGDCSYIGECKYKIASYVDSQNAFGALIRKRYRCVVKELENGNWRLESRNFY